MGSTVRSGEFAVPQLATFAVDEQMCFDAVTADGKNAFLVCLLASPYTQTTQNASIQIEHHFRMGGVHRTIGVELFKMWTLHTHGVSSGLKAAIAAFFAGGTEMVALYKKHLQHGFSLLIELKRIALHFLSGRCLDGATCACSSIDLDSANTTVASCTEIGVPAKMGDVVPGSGGRFQNGIAGAELDFFAVKLERAGCQGVYAMRTIQVNVSR